MATASMLPQILDGFEYNDSLVYYPMKSFVRDLMELDTLRRANNYRPRWWCVPDTQNSPIQPFDTLYYQIEIADGSYFWGYNFVTLSATDPNDDPIATTPGDMMIQAVDSCTGVPLFQDFSNGDGNSTSGNARCFPILLPKPRLILEPGLVNVQITNRTANTITCQLLLKFAELCRFVSEQEREQTWALLQQGAK